MKLFAVAVVLGARWILRRPSSRLWALELSWFGGPRALVVSDYGELQVMRDIVLDEEYAVPGIDPETILDLGANIGVASAWFRARYPAARIVAVEPDPDTFAKLERNLGGDDAVTLVQAAVAGEPGEVDLFRPDGYSIASSLKDARAEGGSRTRVRACSIDELCEEHALAPLDLLKLDVEGAELEATRRLQPPRRRRHDHRRGAPAPARGRCRCLLRATWPHSRSSGSRRAPRRSGSSLAGLRRSRRSSTEAAALA